MNDRERPAPDDDIVAKAGSDFEKSPVRRVVEVGVPIVMTLAALGWAADLYSRIGLDLYTEQYICYMLAMALPLAFVIWRAGRGPGPMRWHDILLALASFAAPAYVGWDYPRLSNEIAFQPLDAVVVSTVIMILVMEAMRRAVGYTLVITLLLFALYSLVGHHIPGTLEGREVAPKAFIVQLALDSQALLGIGLKIGTTIVFAFVFMGQLLFVSGGSTFFTELAQALVGKYRGGAAKIAVTASAFFGSISGSAVSNVMSTGVITIPLMRRTGYPAHNAGAIEAVASTGGQLMPPIMGVTAFVMAELLERPYADIALAALVPAVLYYVALLVVVDLEAARAGLAPVAGGKTQRAWRVLRRGWFFPLPFGVLIWGLFFGGQQPETAALYGSLTLIGCAVVFGYAGERLSPGKLVEALRSTGMACVEIVLITAAAGLAIGMLNFSGLGYGLTTALSQLAEGNVLLLLVVAAFICILLGMGMPTLTVYILLAALVAPSIVAGGVDKMAAHLFVLYFGMMSMITPPIAIAAFAAATLTGANAMRTGFAAMRFGWVAYVVPFLFVGNPALLLNDHWTDIVIACATALAGVWLISAAVVGFAFHRLEPVYRFGFLIAGAALMVPVDWSLGPLIKVGGIVLGLALLGREWLVRQRAAKDASGTGPTTIGPSG